MLFILLPQSWIQPSKVYLPTWSTLQSQFGQSFAVKLEHECCPICSALHSLPLKGWPFCVGVDFEAQPALYTILRCTYRCQNMEKSGLFPTLMSMSVGELHCNALAQLMTSTTTKTGTSQLVCQSHRGWADVPHRLCFHTQISYELISVIAQNHMIHTLPWHSLVVIVVWPCLIGPKHKFGMSQVQDTCQLLTVFLPEV